jgi:hypothetical protein
VEGVRCGLPHYVFCGISLSRMYLLNIFEEIERVNSVVVASKAVHKALEESKVVLVNGLDNLVPLPFLYIKKT